MENLNILTLVFGLSSIIIAISLHEMMHAYVSHALGDDTAHSMGRVTINPLAHIDVYTTVLLPMVLLLMGLPPIGAAKPVPFNPARLKYNEFGMALVGAAGPFTNLLLAVLGGAAYKLSSLAVMKEGFAIFVSVNVGFFIFNMLPIPPLDGSRVFYAIAPDFIRDIFYTIERMGMMFLLVMLIFLYPFLSPLLGYAHTFVLNIVV